MSRKFGKKRKITALTPVKTPRKLKVSRTVPGTPTLHQATLHQATKSVQKVKPWHAKFSGLIKNREYGKATVVLLSSSKASQAKAFTWLTRSMRRELNGHLRGDRETTKTLSLQALQNFSWSAALKESQETMPMVTSWLDQLLRRKEGEEPKHCHSGSVLCHILFLRNKRHSLFQGINSLLLWRSGCGNKAIESFNHLGWCMGLAATRRLVDRIWQENEAKLTQWKQEMEESLKEKPHASSDPKELTREQEEAWLELGVKPLSDSEEEEEEKCRDGSRSGDSPGYALCWDNIQKDVKSRKQQGKGSHMMMWAMSYAVRNRVSFMEEDKRTDCIEASTLPLHVFLPSTDDLSREKARMVILVKQMLCQHIPHFKMFFQDCVIQHMDHLYSEAMKKKSEVISLGVLNENPSTVSGVIAILDHLHKFVPEKEDGRPFVIPCHGDGLSIERMVDAARGRHMADNPRDRLQGVVPVPQEFHKRVILLQDLLNSMHSNQSIADVGTMYHAKTLWGRRGVQSVVSHCFNHVADFVQFLTKGLTCVLAMKLRGMGHLDEIPEGSDPSASPEDRKRYLDELASEIVSFVWLHPSDGEVAAVSADPDCKPYDYCLCRQETDEDMVECSNPSCLNGQWFHPSCVGLEDLPMEDEPWWCCVTCKQVCPTSVAVGDDGQLLQDHVQNYTRTLLWEGLCDMSRRDAVRQGDGPAMISHWRSDMLSFWQHHHYKYLILGHRMLAGVAGWLPERLAKEITWNRTANLTGGAGKNIELDLVNEFINRDFKENLKSSRGTYTDMEVNRASHMVGMICADIDKVYGSQVAEARTHVGSRKQHKEDHDLQNLVSLYTQHDVFGFTSGREHKGYPKFLVKNQITNKCKLKQTLVKYSRKLDIGRALTPDD